jgi:hypothetical protein
MQRNTLTNSNGCSKLRRNNDRQITRISELTNMQANQRHVKEDENMMTNCEWEETAVPYLKYWCMPAENRGNNGQPQDIR